MSDGPTMRASHMKSNLAALRDLGESVAAQIRAAVPKTVQGVEASVRTSWLPLHLDVALTEAVEAHTSRERMRRWSADAIAHSADGPLLGPIRQALIGVGLSGQHGLKRVEFMWGLIFRDCGRIEYHRTGDTLAVLTHHDAPEDMLASDAYLHGISGSFEGGLTLLGERDPYVAFEVDRAARRVEYRCQWSPR